MNRYQELFDWAEMDSITYPDLKYMFRINDDEYTPDICIPAPRGWWNCIYIYLCDPKKIVKAKRKWMKYLDDQQCFVCVCGTINEVKEVITRYLNGLYNQKKG